ncbi:MAG TPA: alpha/beta fold hydrolase [Bradyrhizobium sp.]|nr:alpha/beta fold hydrolase [Bradyrhizobium sp.]
MKRRDVLRTMAIAGFAAGAGGGAATTQTAGQTFVLVHGAWHGGWCWSRVADRLRASGHQVFTPTQTGLGERKHLLSKDITLDVFVKDIVNVIEAEELSNVILVGHSFGGLAISGVADAMPDKIRHLVYLDSLMVEGGRSPFDGLPPDVVAARRKAAEESSGGLSLPTPPPSAFGVSDAKDSEWVKRRLTPHPLGTYTSPLNIKGPVGNNLPRTYIACTSPSYAALENSRKWVKAHAGWRWAEIATGHNAMVMAPDELTRMLVGLTS